MQGTTIFVHGLLTYTVFIDSKMVELQRSHFPIKLTPCGLEMTYFYLDHHCFINLSWHCFPGLYLELLNKSSQWHHNELDGVSNHLRLDCLLNCLFRCRSKKTSKLRVTGLCEGNPPVTGGFPSQKASNMENVSIWWCHHERGFRGMYESLG